MLEPTGIVPQHPTLRPADMAIVLAKPTSSGTTSVAVDVSVTSIQRPSLARLHRSGQPESSPDAHRQREREKWNRSSKYTEPRLPILQALEQKKIALIPFTIDHLGGIGYQSHCFLFHPNSAPFAQPAALSANNSFCTGSLSPATRCRAVATPIELLTKANEHWRSPINNYRPIGSTYHSNSPTQWALQMLSANFCISFATHFQQGLWRCTHDPLFNDRPTTVPTTGAQSFVSPMGGPQASSRLPVVLI